jgi:hypothetical protein
LVITDFAGSVLPSGGSCVAGGGGQEQVSKLAIQFGDWVSGRMGKNKRTAWLSTTDRRTSKELCRTPLKGVFKSPAARP